MTTPKNEEAEFNAAFTARVKALRESRYPNQRRMADLLGVPYETYKKYETRTPLPHYLIDRFAALVGSDLEYVLTGRAANPVSRYREAIENRRRTK